MTRWRARITIGLLAVAGSGCGGEGRQPAPDAVHRDSPRTPATAAPAPLDRCAPPPLLVGRPVDAAAARERLTSAVRAARRTERRFVTNLSLRAGELGPFTARLVGTRRADGSSRATLRWSGAAAALLPDVDLAVHRDRIRIRDAGGASAWRDLGSASGVALDVGRELFDHPFLLRTRSAAGAGRRLDLRMEAPAAGLRAYATTERRGPITELLRNARSLRITAQVDGATLVGDRFRLVTVVPDGIPAIAALRGRVVEVAGATGLCSARP